MSDFYIYAGPNGSGKSTLYGQYPLNDSIPFLNADCWVKDNPDIAHMLDGKDKINKVQKEVEKQINQRISEGLSFAWETVFSHPGRLKIMKDAKDNGYNIHLFYITTKNPDINVARVRKRVSEGGHDVPEKKVRGRYWRSLSFLPEMIIIADEVVVFDNSEENFQLKNLFQKSITDEDNFIPQMITWQANDEEINEWVIKYIIIPLERRGLSIPCYKVV